MGHTTKSYLVICMLVGVAACGDDAQKKVVGPSVTDDMGTIQDMVFMSDMDNLDASIPEDVGPSDMTTSGDAGVDMAIADAGRDVGAVDMAADSGIVESCLDQANSGWVSLGAAMTGSPGTSAEQPDVIVDDQCRPVVAFRASSSQEAAHIYVRRWDGADWVNLGSKLDADGNPNTTAASPMLASSGGRLFVGWLENMNGFRFVVAEFSGGTWNQLGGLPTSSTNSPLIELATDATGSLHAAISLDAVGGFGSEIGVFELGTGTWNQVGSWLSASTPSTTSALAPSLIFDRNDRPTVAWQQGELIHLRQWNGSQWRDFGGGTLSAAALSGSAFDIQLARPAGAAQIYAAWRQSSTSSTDIYVRRWNGSTWEILGDQIDSEPDIPERSNTLFLDLVVDSEERPTIAWTERVGGFSGFDRVFVRRRDGASFAALGAGVLEGDDPDDASAISALAVDERDRVVAAYMVQALGANVIHVQRYRD